MKTNFKLKLVALTIVMLCAFSTTKASHYRYGSISWQKVGTSTNTVQFKIVTAWRNGFFTDRGSRPVVGRTFPLQIPFQFGDGTSTQLVSTVTTVQGDPQDGWFFTEAIITHTYPNGTSNYTAFFEQCCRINVGLINNNNDYYRSETVVNIGTNNDSPVSSMPPIVNLQVDNPSATFTVPVTDPDGDPITFRLANCSEVIRRGLSPACNPNPAGLTVSPNGIVSFSTVGKTIGDLYSVMIVGEDGQSKVINDFLIQIVQQSTPPAFNYGVTPLNNSVIKVSPGNPVYFNLEANDIDPGSSVSLSAVGLPIGSNFTPAGPANPVTTSFSWTPTPAQLGTSVISFTATDNNGVQTQTSVSIIVSYDPVFDVPPTPAEGVHNVIEPGSTFTFTAQASDPDSEDEVTIYSVTGKDYTTGNSVPLYTGASFSPLPSVSGNPTSGTFTWTPTVSQWGHKHVYLNARDTYNDEASHEVSILVNTTPAFTSSPITSVNVGETYNYTIQVTDPDIPFGDSVDIFGLNLPSWLTFTDNGDLTATLSGTPSSSDVGVFTNIIIEAHDIYHHSNVGGIPSQIFNITVNPCDITLSSGESSNETCQGGYNGNIDLVVFDASEPISYNWSNGESTQDIFNLTAGDYSVIVTDAFGCTASDTFTVIQSDTRKPVVETKDITVYLEEDSIQVLAIDVDNGSTDNCGIDTMYLSKEYFDCENIGSNTVTLTVVDINGNSETETATITVVDTLVPTVLTQDISVYLDATGLASILATEINNGSSDNCGIDSIFLDETNFDCSNVGANVVTLTAVDVNGNVASALATVSVLDTITPTVITQDITVALDEFGTASIAASDIDNGSNDNCAIATIAISESSFDCSNIGSNLIELVVFDVNGNSSSASAEVIVIDTLAPVVSANDITVYLNAAGSASITPEMVDDESSDNCTIDNISISQSEFDCSDVESNEVTFTAVDVNGNSASTTFNVTVLDTLAPTVFTQDVSVYLDATGSASILATDIDSGSSDNCGIDSIYLDKTTFDCSNVGPNQVTLTVVDVNGNVTSTPATVTVLDTIAPTVVTQPLLVELDSYGLATISASEVDYGSIDNCTIDTMYLDIVNFTCANIGENVVTLTVVDVNGNTSSATAIVTVFGDPLTITTSQSNYNGYGVSCFGSSDAFIYVAVSGGIMAYTYEWSNGADADSLTDITAGTYTIEVVDINGCYATDTITVTQPDTLVATAISSTDYNGFDISCAGFNDGTIDLSIEGGVMPYNYLWSDSSSTEDLNDLAAGFYEVTTTDANGCIANASALLTEPDSLETSIYSPTVIGSFNTSCTIDGDGSAELTAEGGVEPYSIEWNTGETDFNLSDLIAGEYNAVVTDENGCIISDSITLSKPEDCNCLPEYEEPVVSDFTCDMVVDGMNWVYVPAGQTACINSNYNSGLNMGDGAQLLVVGTANISYLSIPNNAEVIVLGSLSTNGLGMNYPTSQFSVYGDFEVSGWASVRGLLENYGSVDALSGMTINVEGSVINNGYLTVAAQLQNNNMFENNGFLSVAGEVDANANSNAAFANKCMLEAGHFRVSNTTSSLNGGTIYADQITYNSAESAFSPGSIIYTNSFAASGSDLFNPGQSCSVINVSGTTTFNEGSLNGDLFICDADGIETASQVMFTGSAGFDCASCMYTGGATSSTRMAVNFESEIDEELILTVAPNPADAYTTIKLEGVFDVEIYNTSGARVLNLMGAENEVTLDLSALSNSIYVVNVISENGTTYNAKLIVE